MTGLQIIPDGNQYPMVKFKYADESSPPKEIITVFFDEDEKILGINPMK